MPTDALQALLDRDLAKVMAIDVTKVTRPLLRELVNHGTNVFQRCHVETASNENENEELASLTLYLHMLQMTDGIDVLIEHGCAGAAIPSLRSSFEGLLGLEYILKADYRQRSLAWFAGMLLNKIAVRERMDETNPKSRSVKDEIGAAGLSFIASAVQDDIQRWTAILDSAQLAPISAEVRRKKKWYAAFGGPPNLAELAKAVEHEAHYEMLYRQWSSVVHAGDYMRFAERSKDEGDIWRPLRDLTDAKGVAHMAALYLLRASRLMIEKHRSGEDLSRWYLREIRPLLEALTPELKNRRVPEDPWR
jgi:hypothetical protein